VRRQQVRKTLALVSFLLFPVTLYFFSPALILDGASQGIVSGSFILFGALFVSSLFLGRAWCGWVCPPGGLQECCLAIKAKPARGGRANWIKYFLYVPWLVLIVVLFVSAGGIKGVNPLFQTDTGVPIQDARAYIIYYAVLTLVVVLAFTVGRRAFCHYGCWMALFVIAGSRLKNWLKWPSLHLRVNPQACSHCKACTKHCPMSLDVHGMVEQGSMLNTECILCGECVDGCPKDVIHYAFGKPR
jgi:ferredoxin-type protein NapH